MPAPYVGAISRSRSPIRAEDRDLEIAPTEKDLEIAATEKDLEITPTG